MKVVAISILIYLIIGFIWQWLEVMFYGEVQPRIVDDIIGLILLAFIYLAIKNF